MANRWDFLGGIHLNEKEREQVAKGKHLRSSDNKLNIDHFRLLAYINSLA